MCWLGLTYTKGDIVVSTRSWTRFIMNRIDTDTAAGETMIIDAEELSIMVMEAHPTGATGAENSDPLLVVVPVRDADRQPLARPGTCTGEP